MTTKPDDAAYARPFADNGKGEWSYDQIGLTKREHFAALALQGWLASFGPDEAPSSPAKVAEYAVALADALIDALNAPPEGR